jgi:hypothetical protein
MVENLSGNMINDVLWISSPEVMDKASMFWRTKIDKNDPAYQLGDYFNEVGIKAVQTSEFGMVPLRDSMKDINVLTDFAKAFTEDVRLYPYDRLGSGTIEDWLAAAESWLKTT